MIVTLVPVEALPKVWAEVAPLIAKAVKPSETFSTSILDIYDWCLKGKYNLWIVADEETKKIKAAWVTTIFTHPGYRALSVQYVGGGGMKDWIEKMHDILKRFAIDCDCAAIEVCGREGWVRSLKRNTNEKWSRSGVLLRLELDEAVALAAE